MACLRGARGTGKKCIHQVDTFANDNRVQTV